MMTKISSRHRYEDLNYKLAASLPSGKASSGAKAIIAATLGNLLELYDFIVFGMFAIPISKIFFPNSSEASALLLTFLVFGAGFLARPLGALVLGSYADRYGRKKALSLTLLLMGTGTALLAFCPGYRTIGIMAPIIVVIGRLIQGFSAGGEIGSAVAMLVESAPKHKRGYYAAFQEVSQGGAVLLAGVVGLTLSSIFTNDHLLDWGWRIAFAVGLLIVPVGLMVRRNVEETKVFQQEKKNLKNTAFLAIVKEHKFAVFMAIGVMIFWTITSYVINYIPVYAVKQLHLSSSASFSGLVAFGLTVIIACPLCGLLSDRLGRKIPMLIGSIGMLICSYPLFYLLKNFPSVQALVFTQIVIGIFLSLYASCASAVLGEIFPTSVRATGVAVSYALGVMIFGGFTPAVITWLIAYFGDELAISYYLAAASLISCVVVMFLKDQRETETL